MKKVHHWLIANMVSPSLQNPVKPPQKCLSPSTIKVEPMACNVYTTFNAAKIYQSSHSTMNCKTTSIFFIHSQDSEENQDITHAQRNAPCLPRPASMTHSSFFGLFNPQLSTTDVASRSADSVLPKSQIPL